MWQQSSSGVTLTPLQSWQTRDGVADQGARARRHEMISQRFFAHYLEEACPEVATPKPRRGRRGRAAVGVKAGGGIDGTNPPVFVSAPCQ